MEEADDYVPQISQIDYNGSGGGAPGYYDPAMSAGMFNADPQHQFQRHPSMGAGGNPMMGGYPNASAAQMHGQMGGHPMGMNPAMIRPPSRPLPPPPAAKPKRGGRKKATAAQAAEANQPPVQQPLQPSFPPSQPMNPAMMQQMRQQTPQNPYGAPQYGTSQGYPPQAQKWAPDYNQMQYRPPVPPSYMQGNYSMQQGAPQGYYPGQQRPPHYNPYQYPNQHFPPQQGWHPNMQQQHVGQYPQQQPQNAHGQMQQPPQYPAQNLQASHAQHQMSPLQSIGREIVECERQYGYWNNHPKTPEVTMRLEQLQQKISYLQHQQRMLQQQAQQQQVAPAQAPQKTPQPPPVKNYPAYSSNGQMPDPTSSQPMPTISTASTVHIPPEQTAVRRPDSSATAGSSVSVMQTAPNQVQVNITPEAPGRTLISVYHQYPTADVMTTSHNSIGTTATTQSGKDSIPPEPIPSASLASNTDVYSRQFPVSSAPSTSTVNSTVTTESKPKDATTRPTAYGEQTQRAEEATLPPPLDSAVYPPPEQPKTVTESVLAVNTEPFAEELAIEKRKKPVSADELSDAEDMEFIVESKKKKAKPKPTTSIESAEIGEPMLDDFVEKRRSERNRTERKTYSEKMDIDEELEELAPLPESADASPPEQPAAPELVVEKILGFRTVTRLVPKEVEPPPEEEPPKANGTEEPSERVERREADGRRSDRTGGRRSRSRPKRSPKRRKEVEMEGGRSGGDLRQVQGPLLHALRYGDAYLDDQEYFNEDFLLVDRWRSLPYEDCTWEAIDIVPQPKLDEFHRRNDKIDPFKAKERARPTEAEWTKIPSDKKYKDENTLRDYQFEGVNWLLFCYYNKRNCILADEMGLGKTIQTITFLQEVHDKGIHGPFLIVVPLSTLHNWEREFETWTDMNAVVYHGSAASREVLQEYELYYRGGDPKKKQIPKFDALLTTYEMIVSDCEVLRPHQLPRNRNSKLLTAGLLSFKLEHRVLLTGTPLQNNIDELFSLLNFLEPEQFSSSQSFLEQFGSCQTEAQVQELQAILKPMMLRRLKEDVEKSLQPKEETIIEVQLSDIQKKYYRAILERNFSHLLKGTHQPSLLNALMELRKCCNHPFLIKGAEEQILSELRPLHADKTEDELQLHALIQASGKLVLLDKLLPKLKKDGHKVLIFSQMVKVLDLLEEYIAQMGYKYERIDGNIRGDMRQAAIDRFCKPDSDRFAFLLCTRAGGLGINLVAADICIIFDSDWNPFSDLQAQARCHRIGQKKMVKIYRLITTNTYEREMLDKASLKLGLDKAILQSMNPRDNQQMTKKEIEDLLRKGAYGAVMDEDNEGSNFNEEDIDTILQRRTQTIKLEAGVKGGTFAKATFTSSNNEDIDINDPNFWAKWAQKANVEMDAGKETLIVSEPRSRRKRFEENYKGMNEGESEEGDGTDEEGGEPGASKKRGGPEFSKSRSGKKRRRGDDDDDYVNYTPDELTFNKSEYFKVEKLLSAWGWGRWKAIKEHSDTTLSEADIEHISRTLLLHCIREYRGDEKCREFVWQLIIPENGSIGKGGKKGVIGGRPGWAALPEYNPPAFAVDLSFQRHVHRHANKLLQRMFQLFVLQAHLISQNLKENILQEKPHNEIEMDVPTAGDPPLPNWDLDCDKSFLIGIYKHGMENFEQMRSDPKLCFMDKGIEEMPTTIELNTRFKRIVVLLSKKLEMAVSNAQNAARWPRAEEAEFMRLLRIYGVKDDHEGHNVINWNRFREMSSNLHRKTDAEMLEELYCVLAMCTKQQGGELSDVDRRRAAMVDPLPTAQAERLMFRLHLMRKIHAIITTGIHNVRTSLKLCSQDTMYPGWGELQDEQLMIVVDSHGIDKVAEKVSRLPAFEKFAGVLDEASLLRRVMEICTTLETGRWNGKASIAMLDDDGTLEGGNAQLAALQKAMAAVASQNAATPTPGSSSSSQQQQQQLQAMLTMAALSSMMPGTSGSPNSAANKQAMMALAAMMGGRTRSTFRSPRRSRPPPPNPLPRRPPNTNIPVVNSKTGAKLSGEKAPKVKNLEAWLTAHPDFKVDTAAMGGSTAPSSSKDAPPKLEKSTEGTSSNGTAAAHPPALEPGELPKASSSSATASSSKKTTVAETPSVSIGLFNKSTGLPIPSEKCPTVFELASYLDKNPDANVQSAFASVAKVSGRRPASRPA
ncbi:Helicase [Aphelenchoides fujianensis]|nr:Helicase [Aphelenchoides fujianensis]